MIIQPLLDKLSVSFMAERDLYDSTVISIPRHLTTANYSLAASKILLNYGTTFLNTLIVSLAVSVLQIAACTLVGYGFARFEFPFKKFWFAAVIITVIIPPQTISSSALPALQLFRKQNGKWHYDKCLPEAEKRR